MRVNKKMYTMPSDVDSKKEGKRGAALFCLQKMGVLKGGDGCKTVEGAAERYSP